MRGRTKHVTAPNVQTKSMFMQHCSCNSLFMQLPSGFLCATPQAALRKGGHTQSGTSLQEKHLSVYRTAAKQKPAVQRADNGLRRCL
mmetsp:Transcript_4006/g.8713  ORF Transcript_4006/g.8713 Transcript_4006/m.8713 type:complete len:87 (+) Transcript_4006:89-349(+)